MNVCVVSIAAVKDRKCANYPEVSILEDNYKEIRSQLLSFRLSTEKLAKTYFYVFFPMFACSLAIQQVYQDS